MKTSNFSKSANEQTAVAISAFIPKFVKRIKRYMPLAPNPENLKAFKSGQMSGEEYDMLYREQLSNLNPRNVYLDLVAIAGPDAILLCHCSSKGPGCHRWLVAEWLQDELKIEVPEKE
jgi:uncharacterized protein YeaO (DUF488 family)